MEGLEMLELPLVRAAIVRGYEKIVVHVPKHELLVLQASHPGAVEVMGEVDTDHEVAELDPRGDEEIARLQRKYTRKGSPDPVAKAFPSGSLDLERHGFRPFGGAVSVPMAGGHHNNRKARKAAKKVVADKK